MTKDGLKKTLSTNSKEATMTGNLSDIFFTKWPIISFSSDGKNSHVVTSLKDETTATSNLSDAFFAKGPVVSFPSSGTSSHAATSLKKDLTALNAMGLASKKTTGR